MRLAPNQFRQEGGSALSTTAVAGNMHLLVWDSVNGGFTLITTNANNSTKTEAFAFAFQLPENYTPGADIPLRLQVKATVGGNAPTVHEVTLTNAFKLLDTEGAVDLLAAAVVVYGLAGWEELAFTIPGAGLVAGDMIQVFMDAVINEAGGAGNNFVTLGAVFLDLPLS